MTRALLSLGGFDENLFPQTLWCGPGTIPESLGNIRGLTGLFLSCNQLTGKMANPLRTVNFRTAVHRHRRTQDVLAE